MLVKFAMKSIRWMMLLCVIGLASGCATASGNYCAVAQKPFEWRSDAEIDAMPITALRYIEEGEARYRRQCI